MEILEYYEWCEKLNIPKEVAFNYINRIDEITITQLPLNKNMELVLDENSYDLLGSETGAQIVFPN